MVTIAHLTKKILQEKPFVHEALEKELINLGALAAYIQPEIEKELGKVKTSAISMAIRRYHQDLESYKKATIYADTELAVKSNLIEISLLKSPTIQPKLRSLHVDHGGTLNIIQGNFEVLILCDKKYENEFRKILEGESIQKVRLGLSSLSVRIPKEFEDIPGFYFAITKALTMENIPIIEIVNTQSEATFILEDKDIPRAYSVLTEGITVSVYKKP